MGDGSKIGVLFVCLGNICRSPMAEAVFRQLVREEVLEDRFRIDSAGTGDWHTGEPPHRGTQRILDQYGVNRKGLLARQVTVGDLSQFDYIVAMDAKNEADLNRLASKTDAKIVKLLDLVPDAHTNEVPDPYFTGNFEETYELVGKGCRALLNHIRQEGNIR